MIFKTDDVRITGLQEVLPPITLHEEFPMDESASETVYHARSAIHNILHGEDDRLVVIVGPCSVHDPAAARDYASRLKPLIDEMSDDLCIIMRVYFEKPRTTVGWKGLINAPHLDNSYKINDGLRLARKLLVDINSLGLPTAGEYLDMITPQYIADLMSWGAIGARTTESQVHRELASGLSCPVGFKNGTDGSIRVALDAIGAASSSHHFLSVTKFGHSAIVKTTGNQDCHVILRGGKKPNYFSEDIESISKQLKSAKLNPKLMVDFSHANSQKQFKKQLDVCDDICHQISQGQSAIFGVMVESFLQEGQQKLIQGKAVNFGQSITDGCLGWEDTEVLLDRLSNSIASKPKD